MPRGGSRPGAGRPTGSKDSAPRTEYPSVMVAARLPKWMAEWVKNQPDTITATVIKAVMLLMLEKDKEQRRGEKKQPPTKLS